MANDHAELSLPGETEDCRAKRRVINVCTPKVRLRRLLSSVNELVRVQTLYGNATLPTAPPLHSPTHLRHGQHTWLQSR